MRLDGPQTIMTMGIFQPENFMECHKCAVICIEDFKLLQVFYVQFFLDLFSLKKNFTYSHLKFIKETKVN